MPEAGQPDDPELLLENIGNLDTARMTLRWALERIRGLERAHAEVQELLQKSFEGRQKAEGDLASYQKSIEDRFKKLQEKERFVTDMQRILNDLFKGEVDVAEFVKRRQALDEERANLESRVRRRLEEAEMGQKREVEENSKRLTEMESVYSSSLAEAQRRFHAELERIELEQSAALKAERVRYDQFRSETHAETARMAEQYQRRLLILEHEYAGKRREMTEDLDRLKGRLAEEAQAADAARQTEVARAGERWAAERSAIDERLAEREKTLAALETALKEAETAYFTRDEARRATHAAELEAVRGQASAGASSEIQAAAKKFDADRTKLLDEQSAIARADAARLSDALRQLESLSHQREIENRKDAESDLEALRRHFEDALQHERLEDRKEIEAHAQELQTLRARLRLQQEELAQVLEAQERLRLESIKAAEAKLGAKHEADLKMLHADRDASAIRMAREHEEALSEMGLRLAQAHAGAAAERDSLLKHQEDFKATEAGRLREVLRQHAEETARLGGAFSKEREDLLAHFETSFKRRGESQEAEFELLRAASVKSAQEAAEERAALARAYEATLAAQAQAHRDALRQAAEERAALLGQRQDPLAAAQNHRDALVQAAEQRVALAREHEAALAAAQAHRDALAQAAEERGALTLAHEAALAAQSQAHLDAFRQTAEERAAMARAHEAALAAQSQTHLAALRQAAEERDALARQLEATLAAQGQARAEAARQAAEERAALASQHETTLAAQGRARDEAARKTAEERSALASQHEAALAAAAQAHREALKRAAEERVAEFEKLFAQTRASDAKSVSDQIEELRRHHRSMLEAMRAETDSELTMRIAASKIPEASAPAAPTAPTAAEPEIPGPIIHPVPRRWPWVASAALTLTAATALLMMRRPEAPPPAPAPSPARGIAFSHPTGLVWQGASLWATDWTEQALFQLEEKGGALAVVKRLALPDTHPTGLALSGNDVFVSDSWARQIKRWQRQGDKLLLTGSWASPGPQPSALYFDGTNLWSADSAKGTIYRHTLDDRLTVVASYQVDFPVVGLWADKDRLWSADTANRLIRRHRFDDVLSQVASYGLRELDDGKAPLSAFTIRGNQVWLGRDGDARLIERPLSKLEARPALPPTSPVSPAAVSAPPAAAP